MDHVGLVFILLVGTTVTDTRITDFCQDGSVASGHVTIKGISQPTLNTQCVCTIQSHADYTITTNLSFHKSKQYCATEFRLDIRSRPVYSRCSTFLEYWSKHNFNVSRGNVSTLTLRQAVPRSQNDSRGDNVTVFISGAGSANVSVVCMMEELPIPASHLSATVIVSILVPLAVLLVVFVIGIVLFLRFRRDKTTITVDYGEESAYQEVTYAEVRMPTNDQLKPKEPSAPRPSSPSEIKKENKYEDLENVDAMYAKPNKVKRARSPSEHIYDNNDDTYISLGRKPEIPSKHLISEESV